MAIYHASMKAVQRSAGRSSTAAAAYRAACKIVDTRTGECHDYSKKRGVLHAELRLPYGQAPDRAEFWNSVEKHHKRGDAVVARELVIALPDELARDEQIHLARQMAAELARQYGVGVDVCVHEPSRGGDDRNTHAHILMTGCAVSQDGTLGKKAEALDPVHCARRKLPTAAQWVRPMWERLANEALARAGQDARIDHRSHADRGIADAPTQHHGPAVTDMIRQSKSEQSEVLRRQSDQAAVVARELIERQLIDARSAAERLEMQAIEATAALEIETRIEKQDQVKKDKEIQKKKALDAEIKKHEQLQSAIDKAMRDREIAAQVLNTAAVAQRAAEAEQREAGESLLKSALAVVKIKEWKKIENAYHRAIAIFDALEKRIEKLRAAMADAWHRIITIDPDIEQRSVAIIRAELESLIVKKRHESSVCEDFVFENTVNFEQQLSELQKFVNDPSDFVEFDVDIYADEDEDGEADLPAPIG